MQLYHDAIPNFAYRSPAPLLMTYVTKGSARPHVTFVTCLFCGFAKDTLGRIRSSIAPRINSTRHCGTRLRKRPSHWVTRCTGARPPASRAAARVLRAATQPPRHRAARRRRSARPARSLAHSSSYTTFRDLRSHLRFDGPRLYLRLRGQLV